MQRWENYLPLLELAQLNIMRYGLHKHEHFAVHDRTFNYYGVSYMSRGQSIVRFENETLTLNAGDAFLIPPSIKHDHIKTGEGVAEFLWWDFRFEVAGYVDALKPFKLPCKLHMSDQTQFARVFAEFTRFMQRPTSPSDVLMRQARGIELVSMILSEAFACASYQIEDDSADIIPGMVKDIYDHCTKRAILPLLAEKYRLHPTYLSNRFTQVLGVSPTQLQGRFRLERAQELLRTQRISVHEIATLLGYENSNNFTRFFKQEMGCTPTQYRAGTTPTHHL